MWHVSSCIHCPAMHAAQKRRASHDKMRDSCHMSTCIQGNEAHLLRPQGALCGCLQPWPLSPTSVRLWMGGRPAFSASARGTVSSASANACMAYCSRLASFSAAACTAPCTCHCHSTSRWPGLCKHASWRCQSLSLFWGSGHPEHLKWEWINCLHLNGQGAGDLSRPAAVDNVVVPHKVACDAQRVVQAALHLVQHLMTTKILLNFDELITSPAQYTACAAVQLTT